MFKQEKGITLVALVITIIVLLILAGVSISLVVGDNGILTQANRAKSDTAVAKAREAVGTAIAGCQGGFTTDVYITNTAAKFSDYLDAAKLNAELTKSGYKIVVSSADTTTAVTADNVDVFSTAGFCIVANEYEAGDAIYVAKLVADENGTYNVTFAESEFKALSDVEE